MVFKLLTVLSWIFFVDLVNFSWITWIKFPLIGPGSPSSSFVLTYSMHQFKSSILLLLYNIHPNIKITFSIYHCKSCMNYLPSNHLQFYIRHTYFSSFIARYLSYLETWRIFYSFIAYKKPFAFASWTRGMHSIYFLSWLIFDFPHLNN